MNEHNLIIIGGGASGLLCGIGALESGLKDVLLIEQEENLGGNLNLFIDNNFGNFYLEKNVPGPEFATILIKKYVGLGGKFKINSRVIELKEDKIIKYVNPDEGVVEIKGNKVVIASGCREKYTGNILIPIHKYTGIFTTGAAHRLVNFQGLLPGKDIILFGNTIWSYILARRLVIEGANIKAIVTTKKVLEEDILEVIDGFDIPVIYNSEVVEVGGSEKIEWVKVSERNDLSNFKIINCDSLILAIGYYPEIDFLKDIEINFHKTNLPEKDYKTSESNIYCCGTILTKRNGLFNSGEDGYKLGKTLND